MENFYEQHSLPQYLEAIDKSSRSEVCFRKRCSKFTEVHTYRTSVISIKLHSNFIATTFHHGCSPVNLLYIFRTSFPKETSGQLLLNRRYPHQNKTTIMQRSDYINQKDKVTINCQAAAYYRYCFIEVVVKWPDSVHDAQFFSNSSIKLLLPGEIIPLLFQELL